MFKSDIDYGNLLNSIIEFIKALFSGILAAKEGVNKVPGYEDANNWPDKYQPEA